MHEIVAHPGRTALELAMLLPSLLRIITERMEEASVQTRLPFANSSQSTVEADGQELRSHFGAFVVYE